MLPSASSVLVRRGHTRHLLAALLFAVGCSGTGSSCGSSCAGVSSTLPDGGAFKYAGSKLDNSLELRLTQDLFSQLTADNLNAVIGGLNSNGSVANLPCISDTVVSYGTGCGSIAVSQLTVLAGDSNLDGYCGSSSNGKPADTTPVYIKFNNVTWTLDSAHQVLHAKLFVNIKSGDFYVRTAEAHSSIYSDDNGNAAPFQGDIQIDDSLNVLNGGQTELDLDLQFTRSPDGRLLIMPTQSSLDNLLQGIDFTGTIHIASKPGDAAAPLGNPVPPQFAQTDGYNGCDADNTPYLAEHSDGTLTGSGWTVLVGSSCTPNSTSESGIGCTIFQYVEQYLEKYLKTTFQSQIVAVLQQQIDNVVCVRPANASGTAVACTDSTGGNPCPKDDDGNAETCDANYHVCLAAGQAVTDGGTSNLCEPVALADQGSVDFSLLTQTFGFPAGSKMNFFAGLGGKTSAPAIDDGGVQLAAVVGTQPASTVVPALCVPPTTFPPVTNPVVALNFDDPANQPDGGVGTYDVGIALASGMLNQASYDAFNAGALCLSISNKTSSFVSTQLFKTFLPSLGLLTHGTDAPMAILLRPTAQPSVRVGRGTLTQNPDGTFSPNDPLVTLSLPKLDLDFYAVIDERWVRLFTLQADVALPIGLRTFAGTSADQLQPVLGNLTTVITNITASDNVLLSEDPSVVTDLLGAVVQFAQPLLAGILKPIALPALLGLQLQVKGVAGAVPVSSNVAQDGYAHLAIWAGITTCGGTGQPSCSNRSVHTEAYLVSSEMPKSVDELRALHNIPTAVIQASATGVQNGKAEYSYRIDGGLWSPWLDDGRITIKNPMFYVQGHHRIEITSRDLGDDHTQDRTPAVVDFLSSYEAPTVSLVELNDGSVMTRAHSQASTADQLRYAYRVGNRAWGSAGDARQFSSRELRGETLSVRVTDERGLATEATLGDSLTE